MLYRFLILNASIKIVHPFIINYVVGYFNIDFIKVISTSVWLAANYCLPLYVDYGIEKVEVGSRNILFLPIMKYVVGYFNIDFIKFISTSVWLAANNC